MKLNYFIMKKSANELRTYIKEDMERFFEEQKNDISPPLHTAATLNDSNIVRILLEHGANTNVQAATDGMTPLMAAAWAQSEEIVRLLLNYGANPNIIDKDKWSPLFHAAHRGNEKIVQLLLSFGADPSLKDIYQKTPSVKAKEAKHYSVSKILSIPSKKLFEQAVKHLKEQDYDSLENWLLEGHQINIGDDKGNGLLHVCTLHGDVKGAELLISFGANVNRQNLNGETPLHLAARTSHVELVRLFLQVPACLSIIKSNSQKHPIDETNHPDIVELLKKHEPSETYKSGQTCEWHSWMTDLYNKIHLQENVLLEMAIAAGLTNRMNQNQAKKFLEHSETPEAIGLAFALDYFHVIKFPGIIQKFLYENDNSTELGRYVTACICFDSNRKNIANAMLEGLAQAGFTPACVTLAGIYQIYGIKEDQAFRLFEKAALLGNRKAILELSKCYFLGKGTKQDFPRSLHWFQQASQLGITDENLGKQLYEMIIKTKIPGGQVDSLFKVIEGQKITTDFIEQEKVPYAIEPRLVEIFKQIKNLPTPAQLKSYHIKPILKSLREYELQIKHVKDQHPMEIREILSKIIEIMGRKSKNAINQEQLHQLISVIESK